MNNKVAFNIITVTLNAKEELEKTIKSIQSQSYKNFIHIIKDGLSNDKTNCIDFLKYKNTKFYGSKDDGVYDAMNQGFKFCENEYVIFLNAGDIFFSSNTLEDLAKNIRKYPGFSSYSGVTLQINIDEKKVKRCIGLGNLYRTIPLAQLPHPSFVIKKSILSNLSRPFDSSLKISADYKLQLFLRKKNLWKNCYLNQIVSLMPIGGISTSSKKSIINGYKETFLFSYKLYNLTSIYIIFIKLFLNIYSRIKIKKLKELNIVLDSLFQQI